MLGNKKHKLEDENHKLVQELKEADRRLNLLEQEMATLRHNNQELKRALDEAEQFARAGLQDNNIIPAAVPPVNESASGPVTLYYLQPSGDSRFKETSKVSTAAEAVYELWYETGTPGEACFRFIDNPYNVNLSVQNEQTWILIACERSNIPADNTSSVRTDSPGRAVRKNGEWEILQKARITYQ